MSETPLPSFESRDCFSCKDKQRCFAIIQISESDLNETDGNRSLDVLELRMIKE